MRASANDNRRAAGLMRGDTLVLRLVVRTAEWYPEAENGPHITIQAFAEEGQLPSIPAPLIRAETGTPIRALSLKGSYPWDDSGGTGAARSCPT